ncbi:hypothetical protein Tco_0688453 [Tanacetum coccineum]
MDASARVLHNGSPRLLAQADAIELYFSLSSRLSGYRRLAKCKALARSEGLAECKASASNLRRIQVKHIVKEVEVYLKTYSSAGLDIRSERGLSWIVRVICEEFVDLKLAIRQDLGFIPSGNVVLSSTYVGKILGADQLLVILCYRYQESGIGYWILSMTISGSGRLPELGHEPAIAIRDDRNRHSMSRHHFFQVLPGQFLH